MIYYFKGAQILAPLSITSNEPVYDVDTVNLSKQRATQGAQRWELSFNTLTTKDTEVDMLVGMVTGITTADTIVMPQLPSVSKANTSSTSLPISAGAAGGVSSVNITSDGVISKGSFIKFSNHDKIYMVTDGVAAGTVAVPIYPKLRTAVTTSDTFLTSNSIASSVTLKYYRDISNLRGLTFTDGILSSSGTVELVEAIT